MCASCLMLWDMLEINWTVRCFRGGSQVYGVALTECSQSGAASRSYESLLCLVATGCITRQRFYHITYVVASVTWSIGRLLSRMLGDAYHVTCTGQRVELSLRPDL